MLMEFQSAFPSRECDFGNKVFPQQVELTNRIPKGILRANSILLLGRLQASGHLRATHWFQSRLLAPAYLKMSKAALRRADSRNSLLNLSIMGTQSRSHDDEQSAPDTHNIERKESTLTRMHTSSKPWLFAQPSSTILIRRTFAATTTKSNPDPSPH
uniref:Uncharacterized protein n=1 Tax=Panagrellus redivivus TaxID=6233 RepID=A0A7E4V1L7_PANRE